MVDVLTDTVGPGQDYETLQDWWTARTAVHTDLVSNDEIWEAEVHGVSEGHLVLPNSVTTDATRFVRIRAAESYNHRGVHTFGAVVRGTSSVCLGVRISYIIIQGIIFECLATSSNAVLLDDATNAILDRCLFVAKGTTQDLVEVRGNLGEPDVLFKDCVFIAQGIGSTKAALKVEDGSLSNNSAEATLVNCSFLGSTGFGIHANETAGTGSATVNAYNTVVVNCDEGAWKETGSPTWVGDYNAADVAGEMPGGSSIALTIPEMYLSSTTVGTEDCHLLPSSPLLSAGATTASVVSALWLTIEDRDIDHELRNGTDWSIGADEVDANCLYLIRDDITLAPLRARKQNRGVSYDIFPRHEYNTAMRLVDQMVSEDAAELGTQRTTITSGQSNVVGLLRNLLVNGAFDFWQRGTAFVSAAAVPTADLWDKNVAANVTQGSAFGTSSYSLVLASKTASSTAQVKQGYFLAGVHLAGQVVTFSCGVNTAFANTARIGIRSGTTASITGTFTYSSYHTGDGSDARLLVNKTLSSSDIWVQVVLELDTPVSTQVEATFFEAMLVVGEGISLLFVPKNPMEELHSVLRFYQKYDELWTPTSELGAVDLFSIWSPVVASYVGEVATSSTTVPSGVEAETTFVGSYYKAFQNTVDVINGLNFAFFASQVQPEDTLTALDNLRWKNVKFDSSGPTTGSF